MHTFALQLAPVLAAEKSKVPFYVAGGVLVVWALIVSVGIGGAMPDFPSSSGQQRALMAITAVLVVITAGAAVATSGSPAKGATAANTTPAVLGGEVPPAPEITNTSASVTTVPSETTPTTTATTPAPAPAPAPATKAPAPTKTVKKAAPAPKKAPAAAAVTNLSLAASTAGQLAYNTKTLAAKAGTVTITMANMSPIEHNVTIAQGTTVLGATPTFVGGSKTLTLKLKPGKYTFYCSVPGHRAAGMEGTLTVS